MYPLFLSATLCPPVTSRSSVLLEAKELCRHFLAIYVLVPQAGAVPPTKVLFLANLAHACLVASQKTAAALRPSH